MAEQRPQALGYLGGELTGEHYTEDTELEAIKARVLEMEMEEAERLREVQYEAERQVLCSSGDPQAGSFYAPSQEERIDADNRSVYVGNVDYGATADELEVHFNGCGPVNRVTILCDRFSGHPKGFAYIEFNDRDSVLTAMGLDETLFRGRVIKVMPKRTNMPGISTTDRGRGQRGGGRARGRGFRPPPRYNNNNNGVFYQGRSRFYPARPAGPHSYSPQPMKRHWLPPEYREQVPKRHSCLLLITPPSGDSGPEPGGGQVYLQQR